MAMVSDIQCGKDKGVHFAADIDWEEEDRRSCRGSEARRKKKQARKLAKKQKEARLQAALEILQGAQHEDDLVSICQHRLPRNLLLELVRNHENRVQGEYYCAGLRQSLRAFGASATTRDKLTANEEEQLDLLSKSRRFTTTFREYMPASVVSADEEGSGGQRTSNQRDTDQQLNKDIQELLRIS